MPLPVRPTFSRPYLCRPNVGRNDPNWVDRGPVDPAPAGDRRADPPDQEHPDLKRLIDDLDRLDAGPAATAFLARATPTAWSITAGPSLGELIGWDAPPDCDAIGIVAAGSSVHAIPLPDDGADPGTRLGRDDGGIRDLLQRDPSPPVRLIATVDRCGRSASRLTVGSVVSRERPGGGRMLDALLRCLGRPTPPPTEDTACLLAVLWLAAIIEAGAGRDQPLDWTDTVRLHPASQLLLASGAHFSHRELAVTADAAASTLTWDVLKDAAVWRDNLSDLCPGRIAAWMDAGMYSRWILHQLPDLDALWPLMERVLKPSTAQRLASHVAMSLLGANPPADQAVTP